jgi:hypothetical protein
MRAALALAALATACSPPADRTFAEVIKITDRSQLIGGPGAQGAVGDYLIQNDKIRVIVHGRAGDTGSSTAFGGSILDADIQRPQAEFSGGQGRDLLYELGPLVSLAVVRPESKSSFSMRDDDGTAVLRVESPMGNIVDVISLFGTVVPELAVQDMWFAIEYALRPNENFVRISVEAYREGQPQDAVEVVDMTTIEGTEPFIGILKGNRELGDRTPCPEDGCPEGQSCQSVQGEQVCRAQDAEIGGLFGGWLALIGKKTKNFVPGNGFDSTLSLTSAFARGADFFENPAPFAFMAGAGEGVSYALHTDGDLLIPVATSAFTLAISHETHCTVDQPNCLRGKGVRMTGYFAVGEGDIASAVDGLITLRDLPASTLEGVVLDQRTGTPVSKADVIVFADPWPEASDDQVAGKSYEELVTAHREATTDVVNTAGVAGILTHMRSDVGTDDILDGSFSGRVVLPEGSSQRVFLVAKDHEQLSEPVAVRFVEGKAQAVVVLPQQGRLDVEVRDENGLRLPARVTIGRCMPECAVDADCSGDGSRVCDAMDRRCIPTGGCASDSDCDPDESCDAASKQCVCAGRYQLPTELGGHWPVDGVTERHYVSPEGDEFELPAGVYELIASRGIEYSIDRQFVRLTPGNHTRVIAHVERVIDTSGFISADFHVHGSNSPDSAVPTASRVMSFAGEGVELLTGTDHDVLTDYQPMLRALGLEPWMIAQTGVESSPLMLSHFLGFPMDIDMTQPQQMPSASRFDWYARDAEVIIDKIRAGGTLSGESDAVVLLAHVYDYFNYYELNSYNLEPEGNALFALADPILDRQFFSGNFDGFEVANGKSQDYIRKPTVAEMRNYNVGLRDLVERLSNREIDLAEFSKLHQALGRQVIGQMLSRTPAEQDAFMDATDGVDCSCMPAESCAADAPSSAPCLEPRGVVEDWFRMANAGIFRTGVANSDTHDLWEIEAGMPRNYVVSPTDLPVQIDYNTIDENVRKGQVVGTYGPFIRFTVNDQAVGSEFEATGSVRLAVEVQSPRWFDVDRVEVYRNGRLIRIVQACTQGQTSDCIASPNTEIVNLNLVFDDQPAQDSWYAVAAMGINGRDLAPVYSSMPLARLGFNETVDSLGAILPVDIGGGSMKEPSVYPVLPYAITNPIRVIIDGDGQFTPPSGRRPSWEP